MCAILDANVVHEVFGSNPPPAGKEFFDWINTRKKNAHLVVGGKLDKELDKGSSGFKTWANRLRELRRSGCLKRLKPAEEDEVDAKTEQLRRDNACKSDDPHIIALAQIGRVRLLYSNDMDLRKDFQNRALIDNPRGKVYSTLKRKEFTRDHRKLLEKAFCSRR